jgi:hypothetical protein
MATLLTVAGIVHAAPAGTVTLLDGRVDVLLLGTGVAHPASLGDVIHIGDVYRAKTDSRAEISLTDGTLLRMGTNTRVQIAEYSVSGRESNGVLRLYRGKIQVITGNDANKTPAVHRFEVHTPNGVVQMTGTNVLVTHDRGSTAALVFSGQGYVRNLQTAQAVVPVGSGTISFLPSTDAPPTPPIKATDFHISSLLQSFAPRPTAGTPTGDTSGLASPSPGQIPVLTTIGLVPSLLRSVSPTLLAEVPGAMMQNPVTTPPPALPQSRPSNPRLSGTGRFEGSGTLTGTFSSGSFGSVQVGQTFLPIWPLTEMVGPFSTQSSTNANPDKGTFEAGGTLQNIMTTFDEARSGDYGIWQTTSTGQYSGPTSSNWLISLNLDNSAYAGTTGNIYNITRIDLVGSGSYQEFGMFSGKAYGYGARGETGTTWISVGEAAGLLSSWLSANNVLALAMGISLETTKFLAMAADVSGRQKLGQFNVPAAEVGSVNMTCTNCSVSAPLNGFTSLSMNGVKFFALEAGGTPQIWATGDVSGNYIATPLTTGPALTLQSISGGQLSADFALKQWNTNLNKWTATVQGGGTLAGATNPISLQGAAAGSFGNGQLSGTAAGTARRP